MTTINKVHIAREKHLSGYNMKPSLRLGVEIMVIPFSPDFDIYFSLDNFSVCLMLSFIRERLQEFVKNRLFVQNKHIALRLSTGSERRFGNIADCSGVKVGNITDCSGVKVGSIADCS